MINPLDKVNEYYVKLAKDLNEGGEKAEKAKKLLPLEYVEGLPEKEAKKRAKKIKELTRKSMKSNEEVDSFANQTFSATETIKSYVSEKEIEKAMEEKYKVYQKDYYSNEMAQEMQQNFASTIQNIGNISMLAILGIFVMSGNITVGELVKCYMYYSYIFAPIGFLMGLPKKDILVASQLLGTKLVLNEFVAFGQLGEIINTLGYRSGLMMAISLRGFANISSMGICIAGISVFCPEKRNQLAKLAFRGMLGGFFVSVLSSLIVGLMIAI
jgi:CNT family concentrative nucleoside transporter